MANLCGRKDTYRVTWLVAEAVEATLVFPGIPVKVKLPCSVKEFLDATADFGTGHHWMICYGDISRQLGDISQMLGISSLQIG